MIFADAAVCVRAAKAGRMAALGVVEA